MTTPVSICSNALLMLGDSPISSLDQGTPAADRCNNLYPVVKLAVLRSHPWNCATQRVILSPTPTPPAFDWTYQFLKPALWLRTLQVGLSQCPEPYRSEGDYILANTATLRLVYVSDIDENLMDSMLIQAMQMSMAAVLAYPTTASTSLKDSMAADVDRFMKQVRAVDGQDDPSESLSDELLLIGSRY
jgi:hypothetical protein